MLTFVRSLLVWLMVLAIPNQGLAASVLGHCAPAGPAAQLHASMAPSLDGQDRVLASERAGHDVAHAAGGSEHAGADGGNLAQGNAAEVAGKCSVCAACCPVIGMPPSLSAIPQLPGAIQALQPRFMDAESFVPGGMDRPPRTFHA